MSKYKILYAEDDETIAFLTKDHLESYYDVHHFPDGESALHAFPKGDFDLCILDIMMPKMPVTITPKSSSTKVKNSIIILKKC